MAYAPVKRGTILIPSGPSHDGLRKHLFVICSDPCPKRFQVIVPITAWTNNLCDDTCLIDSWEHIFLYKKSYVLYRNARIEGTDLLIAGVKSKIFAPHHPMNGQSFTRIVNGICKSIHTPRKVKIYFGCPIIPAANTLSIPATLDEQAPHSSG